MYAGKKRHKKRVVFVHATRGFSAHSLAYSAQNELIESNNGYRFLLIRGGLNTHKNQTRRTREIDRVAGKNYLTNAHHLCIVCDLREMPIFPSLAHLLLSHTAFQPLSVRLGRSAVPPTNMNSAPRHSLHHRGVPAKRHGIINNRNRSSTFDVAVSPRLSASAIRRQNNGARI